MLFQSAVPQLFNKLKFDFYSAETSARKREHAKRLNFYHDAQLEHLDTMLANLFAEPDQMVKIELNVVKKVINNLAQIYRIPPIRELDEAEAYKFYYDMGVMSPVDILMERDRDLRSREEAIERLKIVQSETKQLAPLGVKQELENERSD